MKQAWPLVRLGEVAKRIERTVAVSPGICRLPEGTSQPRFALWGLRSPHGQEQLLGQRYGQGKPGLNLANVRNLSLPLPPIGEQHRIVAYLDGLQAKRPPAVRPLPFSFARCPLSFATDN